MSLPQWLGRESHLDRASARKAGEDLAEFGELWYSPHRVRSVLIKNPSVPSSWIETFHAVSVLGDDY